MATRKIEDWHLRYQQQAVWTQPARRFLADQLTFQDARRILDVGCGTGALFPDLHNESSANLYGLDLDLESLHFADTTHDSASLICGDALNLPYASHSFDITLCHFLLLWLTDPAAGLAEMARVTRSGGYVCMLAEPDYGGRIDYPSIFERIGKLQTDQLQAQGADPLIGRKLPALLSQAGLNDVHTALIGGHWSGPPDPDNWSLEWDVLEDDLRWRLPADELTALRAQDAAAWESGERLLYVPTFYAWGQK
jgi:SAM-dependent methyltransferase